MSYLVNEEVGPKIVDTTPEGIVKLFRRVAAGYDLQISVPFERKVSTMNYLHQVGGRCHFPAG